MSKFSVCDICLAQKTHNSPVRKIAKSFGFLFVAMKEQRRRKKNLFDMNSETINPTICCQVCLLKFRFSCGDKAQQLKPDAVCAARDFSIQEAR